MDRLILLFATVLCACGSPSFPSDTSMDASTDSFTIDAVDRMDITADTAMDSQNNTTQCPAGSSMITLNLTGVSLSRVMGVPINDGFATGFSIIEGPVWARNALYVSHFGSGELPTSRVYRIDPSGNVSIAITNAGTNGLALDTSGELLGARHLDGTISVFDWTSLTSAPTPRVRTFMNIRFNSPNDLVQRSDGNLYFTDPSWQASSPPSQAMERAYRVAQDGTVSAINGAPARPNGITLSLDEQTLYITGTNGMRNFALNSDGSVSANATNVSAVSGGLDGMGRDCAGNLYITGNDRVTILNSALMRIGELPAQGATNVAFGGSDMQTLYVTTLGNNPGVFSARLNVPGLPY